MAITAIAYPEDTFMSLSHSRLVYSFFNFLNWVEPHTQLYTSEFSKSFNELMYHVAQTPPFLF